MIIEKTGVLIFSKSLYKSGLTQTFGSIMFILLLILLFIRNGFDSFGNPILYFFLFLMIPLFYFVNGVSSMYISKKSKKINYEEGKECTAYLVTSLGGKDQQFYVGTQKELFCPQCGASVGSQRSKFCPECGNSLSLNEHESESD